MVASEVKNKKKKKRQIYYGSFLCCISEIAVNLESQMMKQFFNISSENILV